MRLGAGEGTEGKKGPFQASHGLAGEGIPEVLARVLGGSDAALSLLVESGQDSSIGRTQCLSYPLTSAIEGGSGMGGSLGMALPSLCPLAPQNSVGLHHELLGLRGEDPGGSGVKIQGTSG